MLGSEEPVEDLPYLLWEYVKLKPGQSAVGWVCGPMVEISSHWNKGTKPCRKRSSGEVLPCPFCQAGLIPGWQGYVPTFDQRGKRVVYGVTKDSRNYVRSIPYGTAIKVHKGASDIAPVTVTVKEFSELACPFLGELRIPQDIRRWLLEKLWKDAELLAWWLSSGESANQLPMSDAPRKGHVDKAEAAKAKGLLRRGINRIAKGETVESLEELIPRVTHSKNGTHTPKFGAGE